MEDLLDGEEVEGGWGDDDLCGMKRVVSEFPSEMGVKAIALRS